MREFVHIVEKASSNMKGSLRLTLVVKGIVAAIIYFETSKYCASYVTKIKGMRIAAGVYPGAA